MTPLVVFSAIALILPTHTPGAYNRAVTPRTIRTTVCVPGYTATIRPPTSYTSALKRRQLRDWGYADQNPAHFQEDHEISLSVGGAPYAPRNLWPQPLAQARRDDILESRWHRDLCANRITLRHARVAELQYKRMNG